MHDDFHGVYPLVGHDVVGDLGGHGLDEFPRRAGHDIGGPLRQCAVVDGVGQVVAGRGGREVDPHRDVDDEVLAVSAFVVEHPVVAANPQAAQLNTVSHQRSTLRPP